jgi:hypothetical protein
LEIRLALPTVELLTRLRTATKNSQSVMPTSANTPKGTPSEGGVPTMLRKAANTSANATGCTITHARPMAVCLYRIATSRRARK